MRLLVFHNILFAQYKSIYFEHIHNELEKNGNLFLVVQTCLAEKSRFKHFDRNQLKYSIKYPYKLISEKPLEDVSGLYIFFNWLKYILKFKPTIINFTGYNSWYIFLTILICKIGGIKTILTNESVLNRKNSNSIKTKILKFIKKRIVSQVNYFYTFGLNANNLLFDLSVGKEKIINFGNTFDSEKFSNSKILSKTNNETKKLLFIGRLIPEKNLFNTIIFLSKVNKNVKIQFDIYGDGPLEESLKEFCHKNGHNFVTFFKSQNWQSLNEVYPKYDFFILFSQLEAWGMVANEAQWYGIPVICTSNCGCANDLVIDNLNGKIIENLDSIESIDEIAKFIIEFSPNKEFFKRNNSIFDSNFAIEKFIDKLKLIDESK